MCQFVSGYVDWDGKILIGDMKSHSSAEEVHNLSALLKSRKPPVPFEWSDDDYGESIEVRLPDGLGRDINYYKAIILSVGESRPEFIEAMFEQNKHWKGSLYLNGCDLSTIDKLPETVVGWLDLRGCDLSTIDKLPDSVGGSLDLSGCDLSTIGNLAYHQGSIMI